MILQALCGYYDRLAENPESGVALPGWARQPVASCITLDTDGNVVGVLSLADDKKPKKLITPQQPKRAAGIYAAFLCDNAGYFCGVDDLKAKKQVGAQKREAAKKMHREILGNVDDIGAQAVLKFFDLPIPETTHEFGSGNIVFRLEGGADFIHNRPAVKAAWEQYNAKSSESSEIMQCLVTGQIAPIARLHGNLGGFGQDKPTVVGFNQRSFESFGKIQGANAPVSESAMFKYTTALNSLIADSRHIVRMADTKVLFWAESNAENEEDMLSVLFGGKPDTENDRIDDITSAEKIKSLLKSFKSGKAPDSGAEFNSDVNFHILGISAAKTRLVIRFFYSDTFGNLLMRIGQHYSDIEIDRSSRDEERLVRPIDILLETAVQREYKNIPPTMEGALIRSILTGAKYPYSLYNATLTRVRADKKVNHVRAGIIKGFLNRNERINKNNKKEMMTVALNLEETNQGYLLGRLMAIFEKAQQEALGNVNSSVLDKYLNTALAAPQMVYTAMLLLHKKHLAKSDFNKGRAIYFDKLVGDIMEEFDSTGFPQTLNAEDQGRFIVGYYHQNHYLWTKKETSNTPTEETENV